MKKVLYYIFVWVAVGAVMHGGGEGVCAAGEGDKLVEEMKAFFAEGPIRYVGSPGNLAIEEKVYQRFAQSGFEHGAIKFPAPSFVPGRTALTAAGMKTIELRVLHPTTFRPGNFKERDFEANLIHLGLGREKDLQAVKGLELAGNIAVMHFDCGDSWQRLLRFGVRGFVFYGYENSSYWAARTKVYATEVSVPRFAVDGADTEKLLAAMNKAGGALTVRVEAEPSRWKNVMLRDPWVLIPGTDPDLKNEVFVFTAPLDGNCIIPKFARGAQSGANLFLLMKLLEEFKQNPPDRSVMLVAVNARTQRYLGDRMLVWHMLSAREKKAEVRKALSEFMRVQDMFVEQYGSLDLDDPGREAENEEFLIGLRTLTARPAGVDLTVKTPVVTLAKRDVNNTKSGKVDLQYEEGLSEADRQERWDQLEAAYQQYVHVLTLFNRVGVKKKLSELTKAEREILKGYIDEVVAGNGGMAELNRQDLTRENENDVVREALEGKKVALVIPLELTWHNEQVGFCSYTVTWDLSKHWAHQLGGSTTRMARELLAELGMPAETFVDTMTNKGGLLEPHFFPEVASSIQYYHGSANDGVRDTPAVALRNAYVDSGLAFTTSDTFEGIDPAVVGKLFRFVPRLFEKMLKDRHITSASELSVAGLVSTTTTTQFFKTFKFDELAATVSPELPVPGTVVFIAPTAIDPKKPGQPLIEGDVINTYLHLTDMRATALMHCVSVATANALRCDEDFIGVDHALDLGQSADKRATATTATNVVLTMFACREYPVYERNDSSYVSVRRITVDKYMPLVGSRNSEPRRYGMVGIAGALSKAEFLAAPGPGAVFMKAGEDLKLLTVISAAADKRFVLNSSAENPDGRGFESAEELGPDFFARAAADMSWLNHHRMGKMPGVTNELCTGFMEQGDEALAAAEAHKANNDHMGYVRSLYRALGSHVKAYKQIAAATNDMLKAIIFYMALLLPFCFFVQKLMFKFVRIEVELVMFAVLFGITFVVFRMIHPAFRVAEAPIAILIAFVMGVMACFVIHILQSRFEGEMQMLFRTFTGMDTTAVGYSTVGQKAMIIGVNNMKRRRIRTALTTGTIVLVTFTMLSFSSISKKVSPTVIPISKDQKYTGIFYQWPGSLQMDEASLGVFRDMFVDRGEMVVRRWLVPPEIVTTQALMGAPPLPLKTDEGAQVGIEGVLGLSMAEDGFLRPMPVLPGGRYFSADDASEALLPASLAGTLGIGKDEIGQAKVNLYGHEFTVVGMLDDEELAAIRNVADKPILPIKAAVSQTVFNRDAAKLEAGEDRTFDPTATETGLFYVDPGTLLVLPIETSRRLGAAPSSISIRLADDEPIWPVMTEILTVTNAKFYISSMAPFSASADSDVKTAGGVYFVGSGYSTSIGGLARLIIPLIIAGTIILNTMLGSVYERKYEIAVYNAVGLNPTHIGMFFLAEAFVYSVIGSVGGYLIGQVLAIAMTKFNLVEGINLNFSSLSVVYVIMFTVAVVLLSTLYPARAATRAAVPSGKRKWSLPEHEGGTMEVVFPFIYQDELAAGVMAYIDEYFSRFTEGSTGDMIARRLHETTGKDEEGRATYTLSYDLALAPFDLGVTQQVDFLAAYNEKVGSYEVRMTVRRLSGQDTIWVTTNKPYLEKMRSYLINWRNLDVARHAFYVQQAKGLFS